MKTPRTKKSPTPSTAKKTGAGPASETRKGLDGESVAPDLVTVAPGEVYRAHVGGAHVAATIDVHGPTGRTVAAWTGETEVLLGESVSDLEARGYTVTPWASEAGR